MNDYERGYAAALAEVRAKVEAMPRYAMLGDLTTRALDVDPAGHLLSRPAVLALLAAPAPSEPGLDMGHISALLTLHFRHTAGCGEDAEFPWECDCGYVAARAEVDAYLALAHAPAPSEHVCTIDPEALARAFVAIQTDIQATPEDARQEITELIEAYDRFRRERTC